tara:strand:+ start:12402 stop:12776 length:375 start_codon:yes stop_codon:yes gene_type:complete
MNDKDIDTLTMLSGESDKQVGGVPLTPKEEKAAMKRFNESLYNSVASASMFSEEDFEPVEFAAPIVRVTREDAEVIYPPITFTLTKEQMDNIISVLGDHTVASNGHNNDDVLMLINNLEAMIYE